MSPLAGFDAYLVHQVGSQTVINTPVAATRRLPITGSITVDPQWTDVEVDTGTLDPLLAPTRRGLNVTGEWSTESLDYGTAIYFWTAALKGGETPSAAGTGWAWDLDPSSTAVDAYQWYTHEWYDDFTTDVIRGVGMTGTELTITYPDDQGPLQASLSLVGSTADVGSPTSPTAPTAGLTIDETSIVPIYATDTEFFINSTSGTMGITKLTDTFHGGQIKVSTEIELKRFSNGSNTRFVPSGMGRVSRNIEAEFRFAKTSAIVTEVANWLTSTPVKRYVDVKTTSPTLAGGAGQPFSHRVRLAGHWMTRSDDKIGGNDIIVLTLKAKYDTGLTYPIRVNITNQANAL